MFSDSMSSLMTWGPTCRPLNGRLVRSRRRTCFAVLVTSVMLVWVAVTWQIARVTTCPECSVSHEIGRNAYRYAFTFLSKHYRLPGADGLLQCPSRIFWSEVGEHESVILIKTTCKSALGTSVKRIVECDAVERDVYGVSRATVYGCWGCSALCLAPEHVEWLSDVNATGVQVGKVQVRVGHDHDGSRGDMLLARCGPDLGGLISQTDLLPVPLLPVESAGTGRTDWPLSGSARHRRRRLPHLNVLMVDGLSAKQRKRVMPEVESVLGQLHGSGHSVLSFSKYLQVGQDSFQNWVPMLTGRSHRCFDTPIPETNTGSVPPFISARKDDVQTYYDRLGTVLDELGGSAVTRSRVGETKGGGSDYSYGYQTVLIDADCDDTNMAFQRRPASHVLRKEFCALEAEVGYQQHKENAQCVGSVPAGEFSLDYLRTLWELYERHDSRPIASYSMLMDFHTGRSDTSGKRLEGPLAARYTCLCRPQTCARARSLSLSHFSLSLFSLCYSGKRLEGPLAALLRAAHPPHGDRAVCSLTECVLIECVLL